MSILGRAKLLGFITILLGVVVVGCQPAADTSDRPATAAAGGTVTYNGVAIEGASVTLVPDSKDGKAAIGKTDANGAFKLRTFDPGDGAVPGKYSVTVTKFPEVAEAASDDSEADAGPAAENELPKKYATGSSSGLTAEVTEGGENQFTLELTD